MPGIGLMYELYVEIFIDGNFIVVPHLSIMVS